MFFNVPVSVKSALLGMGLAALIMGILTPHIRGSLVVALIVASIIIILGYYVVRWAFGDSA